MHQIILRRIPGGKRTGATGIGEAVQLSPITKRMLGRATLKSALTTTMISGSNSAGEPIPPHFQFQTAAQTDEAEAVRVLAACAMSQEEFDQLVANRHSLIVDPPSSSTSKAAPANKLIVDSPPNSDAPVDTPPTGEDEG